MFSIAGSNQWIKLMMALFFFSFIYGCGKRQLPLPPVERVSQKIEIEGFQRGNQVYLSWIMPARNAQNSNGAAAIVRIDVYRLAEPLNNSFTLSEEEFSDRSTLISSIPVKAVEFGLKKFTFVDVLEFAGQSARLRYGIRLVNKAGQKASFSNFLIIEPTAKVAAAPLELSVVSVETANKLKWTAPRINVDGSEPVNLLGYNVYRSKSEKDAAVLLNKIPIAIPEYSDNSRQFDFEYYYFVRSVSLNNDGEPLESLESNIVSVVSKDIFAPAPPTAVTIAAAPNDLSLFFATNTETDVAGYRVYRSIDKSLPLAEWVNLTPFLLTTTTFQDTAVISGKTYYYYLLAIDKTGNTSEPSEIVSETAP